jgi:hypothetical protein
MISVMLGIGEYSGRLSMVMRSSGHMSLEPTLEGPEHVLHLSLRIHSGTVEQTVLAVRQQCTWVVN